MLAISNYQGKTRKLPADIHDQEGTPLLSWRVLLLPEMGEAALYKEFRLNERWNSEHNLKLLSKIPAFYRNPKEVKSSVNASYFMPVGKGVFGSAVRFTAIADGRSKTIALVEAKRAIHWTKPEDIEIDIDPEKPLPKFGGFFPGLFNVGFADLHVVALPDKADPNILRGLFTTSGRELVSEDDLVVQKPTSDAEAQYESMKNLKTLVVGMLNHETTRKRFPPAAIRDKEGKPLLSWRVAILPHIEESNLYKDFHLNEPWDSAHNLKLLSKMPRIYRHPKDDPKTKNSSYFMVTGKGMFGDGDSGRILRGLRDGPSKTITLVEAKRNIPWTKPEEIEIDVEANKPLPKLGGFIDGVFTAAFADGSVHPIRQNVDPQVMHAFFTVAGGEGVSVDAIVQPKPGEKKGR
jgi:hypothetical protein